MERWRKSGMSAMMQSVCEEASSFLSDTDIKYESSYLIMRFLSSLGLQCELQQDLLPPSQAQRFPLSLRRKALSCRQTPF